MIHVQVVYALPDKSTIIDCHLNDEVDSSFQVLDAIKKSNILSICKISLENHSVGIYGKHVALTDPIHNGDRIEIYRPITCDPMEIRRQRAAQNPIKGRIRNEKR